MMIITTCLVAALFCITPSSEAFQNLLTRDSNMIQTLRRIKIYAPTTLRSTEMELTPYVGEHIDSTKVFEAQMSSETAIGMSILIVLLSGVGLFWWNIVIPQARTKLALSKSKGEVKIFLDSLKDDDTDGKTKIALVESSTLEKTSPILQKNFLRWFFSDWLVKAKTPKSSALPFLKKAKWNSGDNPILVAAGAIGACVLAASLAERGLNLPPVR